MIRRYTPEDAEATYRVFFQAVREGAKARYTARQRAAWAPHEEPPATWADNRAKGVTFVAQEEDGRITGFMQLLDWAHLEMAYVAPDRMGKGTGHDLYDAVEHHARQQGLTLMTTEASHLAKSFLAGQGWEVEAAQVVQREGVDIPNFRMRKTL